MDYTINCPVCGEEIYREEKKCPFCDSPIKNRENIKFNLEFIIPLIVFLLIIYFIFGMRNVVAYIVLIIFMLGILYTRKRFKKKS